MLGSSGTKGLPKLVVFAHWFRPRFRWLVVQTHAHDANQKEPSKCNDMEQKQLAPVVMDQHYFQAADASRSACQLQCLVATRSKIRWTIETYRADGQRSTRGGACVKVCFSPSAGTESFSLDDGRDGTYSIRSLIGFTHPGCRWMVVLVNGQHVRGSPFVITVCDARHDIVESLCLAWKHLPPMAQMTIVEYVGPELLLANRQAVKFIV